MEILIGLVVLAVIGGIIYALASQSSTPARSNRAGITKRYHDRANGHNYTIEFRPEPDGTYSLWALKSPHNPHGGGVNTHHLWPSGEICVDSSAKPRTLDRAIAIGVYWMNRYSAFVKTGHFPKTEGRVNVE